MAEPNNIRDSFNKGYEKRKQEEGKKVSHTRQIKSIDDVIKILIVNKGLPLREAFEEYEECHGRIPEIIKAGIIWEYDHEWSKNIK